MDRSDYPRFSWQSTRISIAEQRFLESMFASPLDLFLLNLAEIIDQYKASYVSLLIIGEPAKCSAALIAYRSPQIDMSREPWLVTCVGHLSGR